MKKFLFLASLLFVLPASAEEMCAQVMTDAVSPSGQCETYSTPCDVPDGWKAVSSCDNVKPIDFGSSPDELAKLRAQRRFKSLRAKKSAQAKEPEKRRNNTYSRAGRGRWVGAHRNNTKGKKRTVKRALRGRSVPKFGNKKSYARFKQQSLKQGSFKQEGEKTVKEIFQDKKSKWGSNRPNLKARTDVVREGFLKNEPNFYERQKSRFKAEGRRKNVTTHFAELRRKRREANGPYEPKTVRLRKLWKGHRLEGDLSQRLRD